MGLGAYDSCFEQGPFAGRLFEAEGFLRSLLTQLSERGIAYRVSDNDSALHALSASRFGFVVSALGLERELWETLGGVAQRGTELRFGPQLPQLTPTGLDGLPPLASAASARISSLATGEISGELERLTTGLAPFRLSPGPGLRASLFRDRAAAPRVLFVTNTTLAPQLVQLDTTLFGGAVSEAVDALDGGAFRATVRSLEVPLSPQSVRMLELK